MSDRSRHDDLPEEPEHHLSRLVAARTDLAYGEVRKRLRTSSVRRERVPVGHEVSLPLPTSRWGRPAYACFAAPAVRTPGQPPRTGAPDRWWTVSALDCSLLTYAVTASIPFTDEPATALPRAAGTSRSVREVQDTLLLLDDLMSTAAPRFLAGDAAVADERDDLVAVLRVAVAPPVLAWCQRLVPDFFTWLDGGTHA